MQNGRSTPIQNFSHWLGLFLSRHKFPLVILLFPLIVSILISWAPNFFDPGAFYLYFDSGFPLEPSINVLRQISTWDPNANGWGGPIYLFTSLVAALPIAKLFEFGVPLVLLNRLFFLIPTASVGWFTFLLFREAMNRKISLGSSIVAMLFAQTIPLFTFNPSVTLGVAAFPLMLALVLGGLREGSSILKYSLLLAICSPLLFLNVSVAYLSTLTIFIFLLLSPLVGIARLKRVLKLTLVALPLVILVNTFWIVPFFNLYTSTDIVSNIEQAAGGLNAGGGARAGPSLEIQQYSQISSLFWVFSFTGEGNKAAQLYTSNPAIALTIIISVIFAFFALILIKSKVMPVLGLLSLGAVLLSTTTHYPIIGTLYSYLWDHLPGFKVMYSTPHWHGIVIPIYGVMAGATTFAVLSRLGKVFASHSTISKTSRFTVILLLALLFIARGDALQLRAAYAIGEPLTHVPDEYFEVLKFLDKNSGPDDRLFVLPAGLYARYSWWNVSSVFEISSMIAYISPIPQMGGEAFFEYGPKGDAVKSIEAGQVVPFANNLEDLHVRYVFLQKDLISMNHGQTDKAATTTIQANYYRFLSTSSLFKRVYDSKYFSVFELIRHKPYVALSLADARAQDYSYSNFSGSQYVEVRDSSRLKVPSELTLSTWFQTKSTRAMALVGKWWSGLSNFASYGLYFVEGGQIAASLQNSSSYAGSALSPVNYNDGMWHFATMVRRGDQVVLFVDGGEVSRKTIRGTIFNSSIPLTIGAFNANTTNVPVGKPVSGFYEGGLMHVQFYSQALSPAEIDTLYRNGLHADFKPVSNRGLLRWWTFFDLNSANPPDDLVIHGSPERRVGRFDASKIAIGGEPLAVEYRKDSAAKYSGSFSANGSLIVVFWQRFDPSWELRINGQPVPNHFQAAGYANAWQFNASGRSDFEVEHLPNRFTASAFSVSTITITAVLAAAVLMTMKRPISGSLELLREIGIPGKRANGKQEKSRRLQRENEDA